MSRRRNLNRLTAGLSHRPGGVSLPGRPAGWIPGPATMPGLDEARTALKTAGVRFKLKRRADGVRLDVAPGHEERAAMVLARLGVRSPQPEAPAAATGAP